MRCLTCTHVWSPDSRQSQAPTSNLKPPCLTDGLLSTPAVHSRRPLWPSALAVRSGRPLSPSTLAVHSRRPLSPSTLAVHSRRPLSPSTLAVHSRRPLSPSTLAVHSCRPLLPSTLAVHSRCPLSPSTLAVRACEQLEELLVQASTEWQFDAWALDAASQGRPLSTLAYYLIHRAGLVQRFKLPGAQLARFLMAVEDGYQDNSYHNKRHAASVLQSLHVLLTRGELVPHYADPATLLGCYIAAVIHDYEHVGLTNDFLVATSAPLAMRYNDRTPLENHHVSAAFLLLQQPGCAFLKHLPQSEQDKMRKLGGSGRTSLVDDNCHRRVSLQLRVPFSETERVLSLQMALKCADLGHLAQALLVHLKWVEGLEGEFFRQGDREKDLGLPVSPLFDRTKPGVSKSQVGFFDVCVLPLFSAFSSAFPAALPMTAAMRQNYTYWKELHPAQQ
ncbi:MAG: hypothetical protein WDW38_005584 [Sanguina aurantia]